jgi:hypothetical protein
LQVYLARFFFTGHGKNGLGSGGPLACSRPFIFAFFFAFFFALALDFSYWSRLLNAKTPNAMNPQTISVMTAQVMRSIHRPQAGCKVEGVYCC